MPSCNDSSHCASDAAAWCSDSTLWNPNMCAERLLSEAIKWAVFNNIQPHFCQWAHINCKSQGNDEKLAFYFNTKVPIRTRHFCTVVTSKTKHQQHSRQDTSASLKETTNQLSQQLHTRHFRDGLQVFQANHVILTKTCTLASIIYGKMKTMQHKNIRIQLTTTKLHT